MEVDLTSASVTDISLSYRLNAMKLRDNCKMFRYNANCKTIAKSSDNANCKTIAKCSDNANCKTIAKCSDIMQIARQLQKVQIMQIARQLQNVQIMQIAGADNEYGSFPKSNDRF